MKERTRLKADRCGMVWRATLTRADGINTLSSALLNEILTFLHALGGDPECRCAVMTGEGRAFLAGTDLAESVGISAQGFDEYSAKARQVTLALMSAPVPVIAAVNGFAVGGGCELALACDFIYATESACFGLPEVKLGVMPGMGGTYLLPRAIGERRARELLFSGAMISARDAHAMGLVNEVCEEHELVPKALATAEHIAAQGPLAVRAIKATLADLSLIELARALNAEWSHRRELFVSQDRVEGIRAFLERRMPSFPGR
jgi:enoyl-CoA hydratase